MAADLSNAQTSERELKVRTRSGAYFDIRR